MSDDVWAGIPVELREKLAEWVGEMAAQALRGNRGVDQSAEGRALADALRSLLSRLRDAENEIAEARRVADELCSPCEMGHRHHLADVMEKHVFRAGINEGRSRV